MERADSILSHAESSGAVGGWIMLSGGHEGSVGAAGMYFFSSLPWCWGLRRCELGWMLGLLHSACAGQIPPHPSNPRQQRTKIQEPAPPGVRWGSLSHTTGWRSQEAGRQADPFCLSAGSLASQVGALGETSAWIFSPLCLPGTYLTLWLADISLPCFPQRGVTFITCVCVVIFRG